MIGDVSKESIPGELKYLKSKQFVLDTGGKLSMLSVFVEEINPSMCLGDHQSFRHNSKRRNIINGDTCSHNN